MKCDKPEGRRVDAFVHFQAIKLGYADGPKLRPLGSIAAIHYLGILQSALSHPEI